MVKYKWKPPGLIAGIRFSNLVDFTFGRLNIFIDCICGSRFGT